jgi:hypothetical protein
MMKMPMSRAASGLLKALIARSGASADRIVLMDLQSVDWQSLTFSGERHVIKLRVPGPDPEPIVTALTGGLADAEFALPCQLVADIVTSHVPIREPDGSFTVTIEALTLDE